MDDHTERVKQAQARAGREKRDLKSLRAKRDDLAAQFEALNQAIFEAQADVRKAETDVLNELLRGDIRPFEAMPEPIDDPVAWANHYIDCVYRAKFTGRCASRNRAVLMALGACMRDQAQQVFPTAKNYLVKQANCDPKTIAAALDDLRSQGFIKRHAIHKSMRCHTWSLVLEALPVEQIESSKAIKMAAEGNFGHDALHRQALSKNRLRVYEWIAANPGCTAYACAKALGIAQETSRRITSWLIQHQYAENKGAGLYARPLSPVRQSQTATLGDIAQQHHTSGKLAARIQRADASTHTYIRRCRRVSNQITTADDELEIK